MTRPACAFQNRLLQALPPEELDRLLPHLELVAVPRGEVIQSPGQMIDYAHFVESGLVSIVTRLSDGDVFSVGIVGRGGMVGAGLLRYDPVALIEAVGQVPGSAIRLPRERVLDALKTCPTFAVQAQRYRDYQYAVAFQSAACMARHELGQRLLRWLLEASDAIESPAFHATQEDIARLLGVCRPTLSVAASALQDAGLIRFRRGRMTVADRPGLERLACGCYQSLRMRRARFAAVSVPASRRAERGAA